MNSPLNCGGFDHNHIGEYMNLKKLFHRHKYTELRMYPPRPKYFDYDWGFLIKCDCGHVKLAGLPSGIVMVREMITEDQKEAPGYVRSK